MPRLTDADALKSFIRSIPDISGLGLEPVIAVRDVLEMIDHAPTIDAVPVIHARWILIQNGSGVCSACNRNDHIDSLAAYCRYCGAKMDGERRAEIE